MSIFNFKVEMNKQSSNNTHPNNETIHAEEVESRFWDYSTSQSKFPTGDKSADLMILIGKAIDTWAKMYRLERFPPKVVFGQALTLMTSWYQDMR